MKAAPIALVARREVVARLRSKAFLASSGFTLGIVLLLSVGPGLFASDDGPKVRQVGVVGAPALVARLEASGGGPAPVRIDAMPFASRSEAEAALRRRSVDVVVADREVIVRDEPDVVLVAIVQQAERQAAAAEALARAGVDDPAVREAVLAPPALEVRSLDGADEERDTREGLVAVATIVLYGQLLGFGFWIASGVVEEKTSRVIELLLAKASPTELLTGKVVGLGALAFVQLVLLVAAGLVGGIAAGTFDPPPGTAGLVGQILGWFVLGFALYSCMFAVGGALASRAEELQSTTMPISVVAMVSFLVAVNAGRDADGTLARVATFIPTSAPLVLPVRVIAGDIPAWEVAVSVGLVLAAIVGAMLLARRAYAGGAMHLRGQLKLREALRSER